ncbi:MAG TPA: FAD-dependent oxidoreductase, partial [Vicinamibacterales bacterium]|nr:FAD-dependent oxidoreductase [Vicinamibacterales bacterium]
MSRPGATYWHDTFPRSRRPVYSRFRGQTDADVVILGAGLTGCACALSFATAGYRVIVLEADRVGGGATAGSAGIVREDLDASFVRASAALGVRPARSMWSAVRRAALDFGAALRRLGVKCDFAPEDLLSLAMSGTDALKFLRRDYQAQRDAGFEPGWLTAASVRTRTAAEAAGAIRTRGARLDPYRACVALAKAAADRRASIHEGSAVRKLRAGRKLVDV